MEFYLQFFLRTWWLWLLLALLFLYQLLRPILKGYLGEKITGGILGRLDSSKYKVLNDVMVEVDSKTSQIDHVVVSNFGVFVIETKNYSGWIFGEERSRYWTQVKYKRKEKFYNPLRQNYRHVKALEAVLKDYPNLLFIPLVVFSTAADFKTDVGDKVVYSVRLLKTIRSYTEEVLSDAVRDEIYNKLASLNIVDRAAKRGHVRSIRKKIDNPGEVCPRCGKDLKLREGKYGQFKGCAGFPRCKYTEQV